MSHSMKPNHSDSRSLCTSYPPDTPHQRRRTRTHQRHYTYLSEYRDSWRMRPRCVRNSLPQMRYTHYSGSNRSDTTLRCRYTSHSRTVAHRRKLPLPRSHTHRSPGIRSSGSYRRFRILRPPSRRSSETTARCTRCFDNSLLDTTRRCTYRSRSRTAARRHTPPQPTRSYTLRSPGTRSQRSHYRPHTRPRPFHRSQETIAWCTRCFGSNRSGTTQRCTGRSR